MLACLGVLAGAALAGQITTPAPFAWVVAVLLIATAVAVRARTSVAGLLLALGLALLTFGRAQQLATLALDDVSRFNGQSVIVFGEVADAPERRERFTRLLLTVEAAGLDAADEPTSGRVQIDVEPDARLRYGDRLTVRGALESPPIFPGFDYRSILERRGIRSTMRFPTVEIAPQPGGSPLLLWSFRFREALAASLAASLPAAPAGLAAGLLVGGQDALPASLRDAFARTGTTHLLAVSGYNMMLVAGALLGTVGMLAGRRAGAIAALAGIMAYSAVSGGTPSVLRAGLMAAIALVGMLLGRPREPGLMLAAAVVGLVLVWPSLVDDVGFQLSVAATAGLIVLAGPIERCLQRLPPMSSRRVGPVRATAAATLAASSVTLPIAISTFGTLSLVSLPANILAAPLVPAAMLTGAICGAAGLLSPDLGRILAGPAWLFASALAALVELFAAVPSGSVRLAQPSGVVVLALYSAAGLAVLSVGRVSKLTWQAERSWWSLLLLSAIGAVGMWAAVAATGNAETTVAFVDGGAAVRTPGWRVIVIDGGGQANLLTTELDHLLPIWDRRVHLYVATEWSNTRAGMLAEIARRVPIERVAGPVLDGADPRWSALLAERRIAFTPVDRGTGFDLGDGVGVWIEPAAPLAVRLLVPNGPIALSETGRSRGAAFGLAGDSRGGDSVEIAGARYSPARHGAVRLVLRDDLRVYVERP